MADEMPIEEQIKSLAKELRAMGVTMREGFDTVDKRLDTVDKRLDTVDKRLDAVDKRFDAVDKRFDAVGKRFDGVDRRFDAVDKTMHKLQILGEQTNAVAKLGLEGLQGLRESMDAKFADAEKASAEQTGLLKTTLVHVRNRVERVERPKGRGRG